MALPREAKDEISRFLHQGQKIAAIKHLRDLYGFSLEESKILVEALEGEIPPDEKARIYQNDITLDDAARNKVMDLLIDGHKIEAVKFVQGNVNVPLKRAKELVEEVEQWVFSPARAVGQRRSANVSPRLVSAIFTFVGAGLICAAAYVYFKQLESIRQSELITGRVISMKVTPDGMSAPVIEYQWEGKRWMWASTTYSNPPAFDVDEEVSLYVNRENPNDITVNTFSGRWLVIIILGTLGVFFVGIPLLIIRIMARTTPPRLRQ